MSEKSMSGLTEDEAMEFHRFYTLGLIGFVLIASFAHLLVWFWRPWIPDADGYAAVSQLLTLIS